MLYVVVAVNVEVCGEQVKVVGLGILFDKVIVIGRNQCVEQLGKVALGNARIKIIVEDDVILCGIIVFAYKFLCVFGSQNRVVIHKGFNDVFGIIALDGYRSHYFGHRVFVLPAERLQSRGDDLLGYDRRAVKRGAVGVKTFGCTVVQKLDGGACRGGIGINGGVINYRPYETDDNRNDYQYNG